MQKRNLLRSLVWQLGSTLPTFDRPRIDIELIGETAPDVSEFQKRAYQAKKKVQSSY